MKRKSIKNFRLRKKVTKKKNSNKKKLGTATPQLVLGIFDINSIKAVDLRKFARDTKILDKSNPNVKRQNVGDIIIRSVQQFIDESSVENKLKIYNSNVLKELSKQLEILTQEKKLPGHDYNKLLLACYINLIILINSKKINNNYEEWYSAFLRKGEIDNVQSKSFYNTYFSLNA